MLESIKYLAEISARVLEIVGIGIIVLGALSAVLVFLRNLRRDDFGAVYEQLRRMLGRAILLGLEFLIGADIIATVAVEPDYNNVGVLGVVVVIRTFLSFSLEVEIDGRWPCSDTSRQNVAARMSNAASTLLRWSCSDFPHGCCRVLR